MLQKEFCLLAEALKGWLGHDCEHHMDQKMFKYSSCATLKILVVVSQCLQRLFRVLGIEGS